MTQPAKTYPTPPQATVLIVGAGGFIGGFIVEQALKRGYRVWAGVRASTSRRYLKDPRINIVDFDYDSDDNLIETIKANAPSPQGWDYIVWNIGATKCADFRDFNRINYQYPKAFVTILDELNMLPTLFLYMSSLSALGPVRESRDPFPISNSDIPSPNTRYGLSKIKTEMFLETFPGLDWVIFRPTGVYGPHEKDYLMMIKSIASHWDFGVGYKPQLLSFIYVEDLVNAIFDAIANPSAVTGNKYIIAEPDFYSQKQFRDIVKKELGVKFVIPVKLPLFLTYAASFVAEKLAALRGKASTLNRDKYKIMKQRNWSCDISDACKDFGFDVKFPLRRGVAETVKAFLAEKNQKKQ